MVAGMDFRADLYADGDRFDRTERFVADDHDEALEVARQLVVAHGLDHALVYEADGLGGASYLETVGAER